MGRGRAKAKQTKVARQLKYNSGGTDLDRLRAEIIGETDERDETADDFDEGEDDLYARYAAEHVEDADEDADVNEADGGGTYGRDRGNGRRPR